tara:strand:- start:2085 stop:2261 length:177 start_codon:yes stop_codon:yes gene_type:complete
MKTKKHPYKNWEVSFAELISFSGKKFKVTRRLNKLSISETKIFTSKKKAKKQFEKWLE